MGVKFSRGGGKISLDGIKMQQVGTRKTIDDCDDLDGGPDVV